MKKAFVLLLALVMVGLVFAEDAAKAAYTVSGDASVKWGYDLATKKSGFVNDANFAIEFPIASSASAKAGGEGVYGSISITDINLSIKDSKDDGLQMLDVDADDNSYTIDAKIIAGPAYVDIYSAPSFTFNNAAYIEPWSKDGYDDFSSSSKSKLRAYQAIKGGFELGYSIGTLAKIQARVASIGDWGVTSTDAAQTIALYTATGSEAAATGVSYLTLAGAAQALPLTAGTTYYKVTATASTSSADDRYLFAGYFTLTPMAMLTVNAGVMYYADAEYLGMTGKLTLKPITGLAVTAGMDAVKAGTADLKFDANGKVAFSFNEGKDSVSAETYYAEKNANGKAYARMDVAAKFSDASGFVPGLSVDAGLFYNDLLADPKADPALMAFIEKLSYKYALDDATYVKPYEAFGMNLNGKTAYLNVGVEAVLIANTTFTLDYAAGAVADDVVGNAFISGSKDNLGDRKSVV